MRSYEPRRDRDLCVRLGRHWTHWTHPIRTPPPRARPAAEKSGVGRPNGDSPCREDLPSPAHQASRCEAERAREYLSRFGSESSLGAARPELRVPNRRASTIASAPVEAPRRRKTVRRRAIRLLRGRQIAGYLHCRLSLRNLTEQHISCELSSIWPVGV